MFAASLPLIADPTRRRILRLVWSAELPAGHIARRFRVTFGAVSQHLARLTRAGLLRRRRDGRRIYYRADRAALGPLAAALEAMWRDRLGVLKSLAEAEQRSLDASAPRSPPTDRPRRVSRRAGPRTADGNAAMPTRPSASGTRVKPAAAPAAQEEQP